MLAAAGISGGFLAELAFADPVFEHRLECLRWCIEMDAEIVDRHDIFALQILFQFKKGQGWHWFDVYTFSICLPFTHIAATAATKTASMAPVQSNDPAGFAEKVPSW